MQEIVCSNGRVEIYDEEEWTRKLKSEENFSLTREEGRIFFCQLKDHASYFYGIFHIPVKKKEKRRNHFAIYILKERLIFIERDTYVEEVVKQCKKRFVKESYSLEQFLGDFFMSLIEEDNLYLASLEREIAELEEMILQGDALHFNYSILGIKKEISRLYCYYSQMADAGELLSEQEKMSGSFTEKVNRLQSETQSLREYSMQVQDVYQAEINIHQNDVMKLLTIVTTIFLPLTLVAGWYGMNFEYMPEIEWKYGYPVIAGISLLIVIVSLWFFKKKKFF